MQKRFKTVSMMLFLMGAISGTAVAAPTLAADDVRITQQSSTCSGVVKDAALTQNPGYNELFGLN